MVVDTQDAKNRLNALLEEVERGGEVVITRNGRAVARLVPVLAASDHVRARAAALRILERSRGATLGGLKIKGLIEEGRR